MGFFGFWGGLGEFFGVVFLLFFFFILEQGEILCEVC